VTGTRWFERICELPLRRPLLVLALTLLTSLATVFAWPHVRFEPDVSRVLPQGHAHVRVAELLDERSRPARTLWLLVAGERLPDALPELVAALRASPLVDDVVATRDELFAALGERARQAPLWSLDADGRRRLVAALSADGVQAAVAELCADLADDPIAARELAIRDPLGLRWLWRDAASAERLGFAADSKWLLLADGGQALVQLRGTKDAFDADYATALCAFVDGVVAARPALTVDVFGGYAVARADQQRIRGDFERASTCSVLLIALYLLWVMRGVRLPLLVQLPAMLSILWAIPFGSLLFGALPTVAVAAVAVLCGLGVDFAIHYAARYRRARLELAHGPAVQRVQRTTVVELLIDMATTAVTFLAIGAGTDGGLRAFGLLLALGLAGSVLLTIFVLPVLLRFAGDRRDPERSWLAAAADRWMQRGAARRLSWAVIALAVLGAVGVAQHGITLSAQAESLRPDDDPVAAARQRIEARIGFSTIPVVVLWPLDRDPSPLRAALVELRDGGDVRFWSGLDLADTDAGRRAVQQCRADIEGFEQRATAALAAAGLAVEPFAPALRELAAALAADPAEHARAASQVLRVGERDVRAVTVWPRRRLDRVAFDELAQTLRRRAGDDAELHGGHSVTAALERMLVSDLERACALAALLAFLMVTLWLRSLRHGLLALVPSGIGLVATLVLLQLLAIPLSMVSFVAVPFVLGIGVDEGVHLVGHFRHGADASEETGVGIVRTSIGTVLGFCSLLLAESPGLQLLGGIVAFGSLACMLSCLFVLAPLLRRGR